MRNLQQVFNECLMEVNAINIPIGNIESIEWAGFRNKWGLCIHHIDSGIYDIKISSRCKNTNIRLADLKNIIFHEMIHTCDGCMEHNKLWVGYALALDENYGYDVATAKTDFDLWNYDTPIICKLICKNCGGKREIRRKSSWERIQNGDKLICQWCKSGMESGGTY